MESSPDGYVFTEGEMVDEFYQGTKALEVGGVSDPIKSSYGWHIIQRLPLRDEDFTAKQATVEEALFSEQAEAWQQTMSRRAISCPRSIWIRPRATCSNPRSNAQRRGTA